MRDCKPEELGGTDEVTSRTLHELAGQKVGTRARGRRLDQPARDSTRRRRGRSSKRHRATAKREAAAELLAAPAWIVYHVDIVNAPMAIGVKELKIGTIADAPHPLRQGRAAGVRDGVLLPEHPSEDRLGDLITNKAYVDAAVAKELRDDLTAQYLKLVPRGVPAPAK